MPPRLTLHTNSVTVHSPYYSFVSGALLASPSNGQTNIAYAAVLSVVSTVGLVSIVSIQRVLEDPLYTALPGNTADIRSEANELRFRFHVIYENHKKRKEQGIVPVT